MTEKGDPLPDDIESQLIDLRDGPTQAFRAGVDRLCRQHPRQAAAIRRRAEAFMAEATEPGPNSPPPVHGGEPEPDALPRHVGPYRVLKRLGEGGFGEVFLAERADLGVRVALKVIRRGMDTRGFLARFDAERAALARMQHTHIARVLDAGATSEGRPYFTMEYVNGIPITRYCDENRLSVEARLALVQQVCGGVQHAHSKGVVHRDLTANNVLVTVQDGGPVAKIIDFGLAKATDQRLTEQSLFTEHGYILGTPEYMSPEQAGLGGLDVDTRTDVYALGVLLYELLVGTRPFSRDVLLNAGYETFYRTIRETEPERPSTRVFKAKANAARLAELRRTDRKHLLERLRGDLDWIVLKCLEKDRTRRYDTPTHLADDLARHLADEPVLARGPGVGYRLAKFGRRYRGQLVAGATVLLALIGGMATSVYFWLGERARVEELSLLSEAKVAETAKALQSERRAKRSEQIAAEAAADAQRQAAEKTEEKARADEAAEHARIGEARANRLAGELDAQLERARGLVERATYAALVEKAAVALSRGDLPATRGLLQHCPLAFRGFEWGYLDARALAIPSGAEQVTSLVALRPKDGPLGAMQRILVGMSDGRLAVWPLGAQQFERVDSSVRSAAVTALAVSAASGAIAVGREDGSIELASRGGDALRRPLALHAKRVSGLAWSPDGKQLVSTSWDGSTRLWDVGSGKQLGLYSAAKGAAVCVWPGPPAYALAGDDGAVHQLDARDLRLQRRLPVSALLLLCIETDPLRNALFVGGMDRRVYRYDTREGAVSTWQPSKELPSSPIDLSLSPGGDRLLVARLPAAAEILSTTTLEVESTLNLGERSIRRAVWSAENVIAGGTDGFLRCLWRQANPELALSDRGGLLEAVSDGFLVRRCDIGHSYDTIVRLSANLVPLGEIELDRQDWLTALRALCEQPTAPVDFDLPRTGNGERGIQIGPDGRLAATWSFEHGVSNWIVYDLREQRRLGTLPGGRLAPLALGTRDLALVRADDGTVFLHSISHTSVETALGNADAFAVDPKERFVVLGGDLPRIISVIGFDRAQSPQVEGVVAADSALTRDVRREDVVPLMGILDTVTSLAVSASGARVFVGLADGSLRVHDPITGLGVEFAGKQERPAVKIVCSGDDRVVVERQLEPQPPEDSQPPADPPERSRTLFLYDVDPVRVAAAAAAVEDCRRREPRALEWARRALVQTGDPEAAFKQARETEATAEGLTWIARELRARWHDASWCNDRAWSLVIRSDPSRSDAAVALARRACALAEVAHHLNTLGAALLRSGRLAAAERSLRQAMKLRTTPNAFDAGFLALTLQARGAQQEAWTRRDEFLALSDAASAEAPVDLATLASEVERVFGK